MEFIFTPLTLNNGPISGIFAFSSIVISLSIIRLLWIYIFILSCS
ncbi:MAG: hypothetical protein JG776_520 [Caloramator sp.]|jgi:hypothetical protein|nr:hypothetical protein [Caloramator sp.]